MNTREESIDHAAEARTALAEAWNSTGPLNRTAYAQAHATLALVEAQREANEQARIANIIALGVPQRTPSEEKPDRETWVPSYIGDELRPDIKKGLGL